uniref:Uncharacterized protein n=1 Tax=Cacopsylla melanoneura TaxID=428564 RepID=A0A8D9ELS6_9HEMI
MTCDLRLCLLRPAMVPGSETGQSCWVPPGRVVDRLVPRHRPGSGSDRLDRSDHRDDDHLLRQGRMGWVPLPGWRRGSSYLRQGRKGWVPLPAWRVVCAKRMRCWET